MKTAALAGTIPHCTAVKGYWPNDSGGRQSHVSDSGNRAARRTVAASVPGSAPSKARTLLQVVPIRVMGSRGKFADTFALLDSGAQISLCSEDIVSDLSIEGDVEPLRLDNVEGSG